MPKVNINQFDEKKQFEYQSTFDDKSPLEIDKEKYVNDSLLEPRAL